MIDFGDGTTGANPSSPFTHSYTTTGVFTGIISLQSNYTGSTTTGECMATVIVDYLPITGTCAYTGQVFFSGSVLPATGTRCSSGTLTGIVETATGATWSCE